MTFLVTIFTSLWTLLLLTGAALAAPLRLIHMPVNSGDAALVIFPSGKTMLIDTGKEDMFSEVVRPFLERHCIKRIDYFMKSHGHADHVGGEKELQNRGMIDERTEVWDNKSFKYGDRFKREGVNFLVYNVKDSDMHGSDANLNSLAVRMEYNGWVYTTGGDEGKKSMERFLEDFPEEVPAHVRKIAHHMWGPLDHKFLRKTNAHLYITTNRANIIGMESPWDDWDKVFIPKVVNYLHKNGGRIDEPGYAVTGKDGFICITVNSKDSWDYITDKKTNFKIPGYKCNDDNNDNSKCGKGSTEWSLVKKRCPDSKCRVLAKTKKAPSCNQYCQKQGLKCKQVWEDKDNTCNDLGKKTYSCGSNFKKFTTDMVCECRV